MSTNANYYYYAAAAATTIAGILHILLFSNTIGRNPMTGIFFLVGGLAQLFWTIPMVKKWGSTWYYIGIAGTLVLIICTLLLEFQILLHIEPHQLTPWGY